MNKYIIKYKTKEGSTSSCWFNAESEDDAIDQFYDEYWDIDTIISIAVK